MGATVIKVEPPTGAPLAPRGPVRGRRRRRERSLAYWYYNIGKRSVVLDIATSDGREQPRRAAAPTPTCSSPRCTRPSSSASASISTRSPHAHPRLIVVSITPFGLTGPWARLPLVGPRGHGGERAADHVRYDDHSIPPIRPGGDQAFHIAAIFAHIAALLGADGAARSRVEAG